MSILFSTHALFSTENEASIIQRILQKIGEKLQALVPKIGRQCIEHQQDNEIFAKNKVGNQVQGDKQTILSVKQKSMQILYQIEILQIFLAEKNLPQILVSDKIIDPTIKGCPENIKTKKGIEFYIEHSFSGEQKQKSYALKEILLTLCQQSQLPLKSKSFLKAEIQDHFSKTEINEYFSIEDSKSTTEAYLQKFISQIGELRQQIETLSQENCTLTKQNTELNQKLLNLKKQNNFQNPQVISDPYQPFLRKDDTIDSCEFCLKFFEDNKFMAFQLKKSEEVLTRKQHTIKDMNQEFSREVYKYNKVFEKLQNQNTDLKRYIDQDLTVLIQDLEKQIAYLQSEDRCCGFQPEQRRKSSSFLRRQNQYLFTNPKFNTQYSRNDTQEYLNPNVFSECSIKNYCPSTLRNRITLKVPQRSRSKHSQQSRPPSYKSHSPNSQIRKTVSRKYLQPPYERACLNTYHRR